VTRHAKTALSSSPGFMNQTYNPRLLSRQDLFSSFFLIPMPPGMRGADRRRPARRRALAGRATAATPGQSRRGKENNRLDFEGRKP